MLKSVNRQSGNMEYDLFKKIIDDSKGFDKKFKKIMLYKDGEPLVNKDLGKMIVYAKKSEVSHSVEITTNASLFTEEKIKEIIDSGLDEIRISIYDVDDEGYGKITKTFSNYKKIITNVTNLFKEKEKANKNLIIRVKMIGSTVTSKALEKFQTDFSSISDIIEISRLMGWDSVTNQNGRDFSLGKSVESQPEFPKNFIACPEPFYTMVVNFNGKVSCCCVDWSMSTIVGDVNTENLVDIWKGNKMREFRNLHLDGKRKCISACSNCEYPSIHTKKSYIDDKIPLIKERLIQYYNLD